MTLTKADIVESIVAQIDLTREEARDLVDNTLEEIRASLVAGETVKLSGFGNFEVREKKQRPGRNPKTGEEIPISARRVVSFKAGQKLKIRVGTSKPK